MSGGGGGGSGMMMAMMMQQQQAQQAAQAEQARIQGIESGRQFDVRQAFEAQQAQVAAQAAAQQRLDAQSQYESSQQSQRDYMTQQQSAQAAQLAAQSQEAAASRQFQLDMYNRQQQQAAAQQAAAEAAQQKKLDTWNNGRNSAYSANLADAMQQLAGKGITDGEDLGFVQSGFSRANSSIPELGNYQGAFDGLANTLFGQLTSNKQAKFSKQYNQLFPTDFATTKVADTTDDDILNAIMGDQYKEGMQNAQRLKDRGVITGEGYDANIKALDKQKPGALSKLTTIGDNQLNSERTNLTGIANTGRQAIANYQLGDAFNPLDYQNKVNSAYDTWFSGLDTKLRGLAPTDLFDTSGFLNTAGAVQGPINSPFTGSTNALTGQDALSDSEEKKKSSSNALGSAATGVF